MTIKEAEGIVRDYENRSVHTEEDEFAFIEALKFLIEETKSPRYMMWLGGYYYELKHFDLALKYYEMAAALDDLAAYECLGYIWYYGRTGTRDFKKAFEYFSKMMNHGHPVATYKVADMYKNGYYVEQNIQKYEEIITKLYEASRYWRVPARERANLPLPEIYTRMARISVDHGKKDDAIDFYLAAKPILEERIRHNAFFGNMNIMKWLIDDLYTLMDFDEEDFDLYDLYYLLKSPHRITFECDGHVQELESVLEGEECTVCFNGKWYRTRDDFFREAIVNGEKITALSDRLYGFEVLA